MGNERIIRVPAVYGGISDQPAHLRRPQQVEDAEDVSFSVIDGASKRQGTCYAGEVTDLTAEENYRLHGIERDATEQYVVVYGGASNSVRVFTKGGMEATVNLGSGVSTYLTSGSATADDLRFVTIADSTFIINTKVSTALSTTDDFAVERVWPTFDDMVSHTPAANTYHKVEETGEFYQYTPPSGVAWPVGVMNTLTGNAQIAPDGDYDDTANNPGGFKVGLLKIGSNATGVSYNNTAKTITKTGYFAGYTFKAGDQLWITGDGGSGVMTAGYYNIASRDSDDQITLTTTAGSGNASDATLGGIGVYAQAIVNFTTSPQSTMHGIAAEFQQSLREDGHPDILVSWVKDSSSSGHFEITGPWAGSTSEVRAPDGPGGSAYNYATSSRAFVDNGSAPHQGSGSPTNQEMSPDDRWTRVAAPNSPNGIPDASTMPVQMVRTSAESGAVAAVFDISQVEWNGRESGDEDTNPAPDLFTEGAAITDMAIHRNRLVLCGDEYVAFSQAGDLFNFFIEDASNITDSDPIDLQLSSEQVTRIDHMVPFRKSLLLFTKVGRQFELNTPDSLTPSNASISPSTTYRTLEGLRPVVVADRAYFCATGTHGDTSMLEYFYDDIRVSNRADDVTTHAVTVLPSGVRTLAGHANTSIVLAIGTDSNTLYAYQPWWAGTEKIQSAWTKWTFGTSAYRICDITIIGNDVILLIEDPDTGLPATTQWVFEALPIGEIDDNATCIQLGEQPVSGAYSGSYQTATICGGSGTICFRQTCGITEAIVAHDGNYYALASGTVSGCSGEVPCSGVLNVWTIGACSGLPSGGGTAFLTANECSGSGTICFMAKCDASSKSLIEYNGTYYEVQSGTMSGCSGAIDCSEIFGVSGVAACSGLPSGAGGSGSTVFRIATACADGTTTICWPEACDSIIAGDIVEYAGDLYSVGGLTTTCASPVSCSSVTETALSGCSDPPASCPSGSSLPSTITLTISDFDTGTFGAMNGVPVCGFVCSGDSPCGSVTGVTAVLWRQGTTTTFTDSPGTSEFNRSYTSAAPDCANATDDAWQAGLQLLCGDGTWSLAGNFRFTTEYVGSSSGCDGSTAVGCFMAITATRDASMGAPGPTGTYVGTITIQRGSPVVSGGVSSPDCPTVEVQAASFTIS